METGFDSQWPEKSKNMPNIESFPETNKEEAEKPTPSKIKKEKIEKAESPEFLNMVRAVDEMYEMSGHKELEPTQEEINEYIDKIRLGIPLLQDKMENGNKKDFFSALRILSNFFEGYDRSNYLFFNWQVKDLLSSIQHTAYYGIKWKAENYSLNIDKKEEWADFLRCLGALLESETDFIITWAFYFLANSRPMQKEMRQRLGIKSPTAEQRHIERFLKNRGFEICLVRAIERGMHDRKTPNTICYGGPILKNILKKYKLDPEDVLSSWLSRKGEKALYPRIRDNFFNIRELEDFQKGSTEFLYQNYGIRNFDRYPWDLLINQVKEHGNKEKPYGVIIGPTSDHNGAFSQLGNLVWHSLYEQLSKAGYLLRVIECESKLELVKRLRILDRNYGDQQKISFSFICGHGSNDNIAFGQNFYKNELRMEDLLDSRAIKTRKYLRNHPVLVLISCSTGAESGIGQELSKLMKARVVAPDSPTNVSRISVLGGGGMIDFDVEYIKEGSAKTYVAGQEENK